MEYFLFINLCRKTTGFVILLVLQIVLFSLFYFFLFLAQSYYHYFSLSYMWSGISSSKIFRWYCMVCRFSYILCTLSTVLETINVSLASYDYILVNRGKSQTTTITFCFYHYDWLNEYINCSNISFHSTFLVL